MEERSSSSRTATQTAEISHGGYRVNNIFVIVLHFSKYFQVFSIFRHLHVLYGLLYNYSTKKMEGNGQELEE